MQESMQVGGDPRRDALDVWVAQQSGVACARGAPASSDASFRRYFRYAVGGSTVVAMDAPPEREDCGPFVAVAALLRERGVHVPAVLAADLERGFLLLSDLGRDTYLQVLDESNADALFDAAIETLVRLQGAAVPEVLPRYDETLLRRELQLFPDWYLARHLALTPNPVLERSWQELCGLLVARALAQPRVLVHRDYMPRNLMLSEPNPGVLDFQDAVLGPLSYDPVCLFRDAFISWPEARVAGWLRHYWERAAAAGLPVPPRFADFQQDCDWMGVQRHLKVLGIFARIRYRDGKPTYLEDAPRFLAYLRAVGERYPELSSLREVLDGLALPA